MASEEGRRELLGKLAELKSGMQREIAARLARLVSEWHVETAAWLESAKLKDAPRANYGELCLAAKQFVEIFEGGPAPASCSEAFSRLFASAAKEAPRKAKTDPVNLWLKLRSALKAEEKGVTAAFGTEREEEGLDLAARFLELVRLVRLRYERDKAESGLLDFDDLIGAARRMFLVPAEARRRERAAQWRNRLAENLRHLLVDEFQDTDSLQWDIVRAVSGLEGGSGNTLFIVGDAQQAIYGWRGGDLNVFRRAEAAMSGGGGGALCKLKNNYRSHPGVVEFLNGFFSRLFGLDWDEAGAPRSASAVDFQEMTALREQGETAPRVVAVHQGSGGGEEADEAQGVAAFIHSVLSSPQSWPALAAYSGVPQIAVLTRNSKELAHVAQALEAIELPYSISHSSGFFELEEIVQLQDLIQLLLEPGDARALVAVLRSAVGGLSDGELLKLRLALGGDWSKLTAAEAPEAYRSLAGQIERWRKSAAMLKPSQLLEAVVRETGLEAAYLAAQSSESYRNIERLIDALRLAEKQGVGGSLPAAREWLRQQRFDASSAPSANRSSHPVVLMTVHGAKGLEFPFVILPFLKPRKPPEHDFIHGELGGKKYLAIRVEDENEDFRRTKTFLQFLLERSERVKRAAEERRLFYVACTRAREYLALFVRQSKTWLDDQEELQGRSAAQRAQCAFESDWPYDWLGGLMDVDNLSEPLSWGISGGFRVPIIRQ